MVRLLSIASGVLVVMGASFAIAQQTGNPKEGKVTYERLCLRCHGEKLDGRGPEAKFLTSPSADLSSLSSRTKSDFELLITIAHGALFTPMHGFRDVLSEQQIRHVLSYIRMQAPFKPIT
jgi:mono/diheme cytochrome c family protein